jgi:NAD(P)-dependent dehydrogenase (short-subunit alcohol dehydrogenase family)
LHDLLRALWCDLASQSEPYIYAAKTDRRWDQMNVSELFDLRGQVAVVTAGGGLLCGAMARALGTVGVKVAVVDIDGEAAEVVAADIRGMGGEAVAIQADVLDRQCLDRAAGQVRRTLGGVTTLINGAGGNKPDATTSSEMSFFDVQEDAVRWVFAVNFLGTLLCSQVFGKDMAERGSGVILNISSMNAFRPLTRLPAYSPAKAAVSNFTQWLAVHLAQEYSAGIRVNAIAPGFFVSERNRHLLIDEETGDLTPRGQAVIAHTPMARFGVPEDLIGTVFWLLSPAASFVTGVVVPVDGGFNACSGV